MDVVECHQFAVSDPNLATDVEKDLVVALEANRAVTEGSRADPVPRPLVMDDQCAVPAPDYRVVAWDRRRRELDVDRGRVVASDEELGPIRVERDLDSLSENPQRGDRST
jgi:hypothetical protein